ncbi:endoribonuclease YbeY [Bacteroidia bacterium]|nr:endoribonuclease YbeY [Bacteroidia bacterium]
MKKISFFSENIEMPAFFAEETVLKWFAQIASVFHVKLGELSFIFCKNEYILKMNNQYLGHDYYTDVITFDYTKKKVLSGDIFISLDTVLSNSEEYHTDFEEEFHRVLCHSLLHLIGFKDKTDADSAVMRENEEKCLELFKNLSSGLAKKGNILN